MAAMAKSALAFIMGPGFATQGMGLVMHAPPERTHESIRVVEGTDALSSFAQYITAHGKTYSAGSAEFHMRLELYQRRAAEVEHHNSQADRMWTAGLNKFSDRTDEELASYRGFRHGGMDAAKKSVADESDGDLDMTITVPDEKNWTDFSSLSFIRDQGGCGSCWAVSATTVLAAHSEIHGTNRTFSTQQLVDCVPNPKKCGGTGGCQGATVELAFQYTMNIGAQEPEEYGGYTATDGTCHFEPQSLNQVAVRRITDVGMLAKVHEADPGAPGHNFGMYGWQKLRSNQERPLLVALATKGPVGVAVAANSIMSYSYGLINKCDDWILNHAVTAVGFGVTDDGKKYWLIQNSWGPTWGEHGRFRLLRTDNEDENCGTDTKPEDGLACEGQNDPITVCGTCGVIYDSVMPLFRNPHGDD